MTLRGLIESVGNGTFLMDVLSPEHEITAYEAFSGSLDAAKRLHDALLPGWIFDITNGSAFVMPLWDEPHPPPPAQCVGESDVDARAWLLAVLRALDDQREGGPT